MSESITKIIQEYMNLSQRRLSPRQILNSRSNPQHIQTEQYSRDLPTNVRMQALLREPCDRIECWLVDCKQSRFLKYF